MADLSGVTVTIEDIRRSGYCVAGAKRWFRAHEMDFSAFLKTGMPAAEFVERGDELAAMVVRQKFERERADG